MVLIVITTISKHYVEWRESQMLARYNLWHQQQREASLHLNKQWYSYFIWNRTVQNSEWVSSGVPFGHWGTEGVSWTSPGRIRGPMGTFRRGSPWPLRSSPPGLLGSPWTIRVPPGHQNVWYVWFCPSWAPTGAPYVMMPYYRSAATFWD